MKGLWKYIPPFAPDQSGACAVLCELGGLIIIIDAGGCAGNICGFDEPRWFASKSAIFSAGLRDMDAILGRDEKLVDKTVRACEQIDAAFVALVGTPVPAVIGTDYRALKTMIHKRTGLPVLTAQTTGTYHYDRGASEIYLQLVKEYAKVSGEPVEKTRDILYLGAIPLDTDGLPHAGFFGQGEDLEALTNLSAYDDIQVIAPSALAAAKWLAKKYGIAYQVSYPLETLVGYDHFKAALDQEEHICRQAKKILIVQQQVLANSVREEIEKVNQQAQIQVASWFMLEEELKREGDLSLREEDEWISLVKEQDYDLIIADSIMEKAIPDYQGSYISLPHYALSGRSASLEGFNV